MKFANGVVGGLTGSFVLDDMFWELALYPANSSEKKVYSNTVFGNILEKTFTYTFRNRINRFVEQADEGCTHEEIDGSGADGLAAQKVLAAAIRSIENGTVEEVG